MTTYVFIAQSRMDAETLASETFLTLRQRLDDMSDTPPELVGAPRARPHLGHYRDTPFRDVYLLTPSNHDALRGARFSGRVEVHVGRLDHVFPRDAESLMHELARASVDSLDLTELQARLREAIRYTRSQPTVTYNPPTLNERGIRYTPVDPDGERTAAEYRAAQERWQERQRRLRADAAAERAEQVRPNFTDELMEAMRTPVLDQSERAVSELLAASERALERQRRSEVERAAAEAAAVQAEQERAEQIRLRVEEGMRKRAEYIDRRLAEMVAVLEAEQQARPDQPDLLYHLWVRDGIRPETPVVSRLQWWVVEEPVIKDAIGITVLAFRECRTPSHFRERDAWFRQYSQMVST